MSQTYPSPGPGGAVSGAGGGGGIPFTIFNEVTGNSGGSTTTSCVITFPQTPAASGVDTLWIIASVPGAATGGTLTNPVGWTVDINENGTNGFSRFELLHIASGTSVTSATISWVSAGACAYQAFEMVGTHALDQFTANTSANVNPRTLPAITPTAGSLVFAMISVTQNGATQALITNSTAGYQTLVVPTLLVGGGRALVGFVGLSPAKNVSINPPPANFFNYSFYSGGDEAYATFSIL